MANAIEAAREIADATGVALPTVENIARRLGEAGWLPRGGRGRNAAQLGPTDLATLLVGVMAVAGDALETPASRIQAAIARIRALSPGGEAIDSHAGEAGAVLPDVTALVQNVTRRLDALSRGGEAAIDIYEMPDGRLDDVPSGAFVANIAAFIAHPVLRADQGVQALGLQFGGGSVVGWIEMSSDLASNNVTRRVYFGLARAVLTSGMQREVRIGVDVLDRMSDLLDRQDERQDELPVTATKVVAA